MEDHQPSTLQLVSVRWWNASAYYAVSLAEALQQAGIETIIAGRESSPPLLKAQEWALPTFTGIDLESLNIFKASNNIRKLHQYISGKNFRVINAHRPEDGLFAVLSQWSSRNLRSVIRTVSDVRAPKDHPVNRWLYQFGFDHLIFSCRASLERYQAVWPIFNDRSTVIYSAIDTEVFKPEPIATSLRARLNIPAEALVVGIIARLSPVKDHRTFLIAASKVVQEAPGTIFLICGESAQIHHDDLRRLAGELEILENLRFLERDPALSARDLIRAIDIGVVTSNGSEVICRIAVEYMAMGKPQVTSDINVLPEIIDDGQNGFVVPAGDADGFAHRLLALIRSNSLREKMGDTARRYAIEKYSYPVFASQTLTVYKEAIRKKLGDG